METKNLIRISLLSGLLLVLNGCGSESSSKRSEAPAQETVSTDESSAEDESPKQETPATEETSSEDESPRISQNIDNTFKSTLKKTGQMISYEPFDDGEYQIGINHSYSRKNDIVTDNVTGLKWQDFQEDADRKKHIKKNWEDANIYCKELSFGEYANWRLPTLSEVRGILNFSKTDSLLDKNFLYIPSNMWTSTPHATKISDAWFVGYSSSLREHYRKKTDIIYVRCVHGAESSTSNEFKRDKSGIVFDEKTGLEWQDDYRDLSNDDDYTFFNENGGLKHALWQNALVYCEGLSLGGKRDWRLPNQNELMSIVDFTQYDPAINSIFQKTISNGYLSSTTSGADTSKSFKVDFDLGIYSTRTHKMKGSVRCVRGGK